MFPKIEKKALLTTQTQKVKPNETLDCKSAQIEEKVEVKTSSSLIDIANVFESRKSLTEQEKSELKEKIWTPPKDFEFPKNAKNLRCKIEWVSKYDMLMYSLSKDALFCLSCILMDTNKARSNLAKPCGLNNWNTATVKLKQHYENHHDSEQDLKNLILCMKNPALSIDATANKVLSVTIQRNRKMIRPIIATLITLGKQNIAIRGHRDDSQHYLAETPG